MSVSVSGSGSGSLLSVFASDPAFFIYFKATFGFERTCTSDSVGTQNLERLRHQQDSPEVWKLTVSCLEI